MKDEVIEELWSVKDGLAKEHDYDFDSLVAHLRSKSTPHNPRIHGLTTAAAERSGLKSTEKNRRDAQK